MRLTAHLKVVFAGRNILLLLGIFLGLFAGGWSHTLEPSIVPILGGIMTLASLGARREVFRPFRALALSSLVGILMNYVLLSGLILALARLLIPEQDIFTGFVVIAAVPPAVAVAPFTQMLGGDTTFSLRASVGAHLGGLLAAPAIGLIFLDVHLLSPPKIVKIVMLLIIGPVVLSRIIISTGYAERADRVRGTLTNWGFFFVTYTIVGLNRELILGHPGLLGPVALVAVLTTFVLGFAIRRTARAFGINRETQVSLSLIGTLKNYGLAAAVALSLFGERAALPASVATVAMILYFIWLDLMGEGRRRAVSQFGI